MSYKIERPKNAPDWFVPGIVCKVQEQRNQDELPRSYEVTIVWYDDDCKWGKFLDINGDYWGKAEPVEQWKPNRGGIVAVWTECSTRVSIRSQSDIHSWNTCSPVTHEWMDAGCPMEVSWWKQQPNVYEPEKKQ